MQPLDRLNLSAYYAQRRDPAKVNHHLERFYFSPQSTEMRRKWTLLNATSNQQVDPWPSYALQALMTVLNNPKVDKTDLSSVLNAFNQQRYQIAVKTNTLGQYPGWEFGRPRQKPLRTPCNNIPGMYQSGYQLFRQEHVALQSSEEVLAVGLNMIFKRVINYACPRDTLLGDIGFISKFEYLDEIPAMIKSTVAPGTEQLNIIYELNHFDQAKIPAALEKVASLYDKIISQNYVDGKTFMRDLGRIHRYLAIICSFERGSSAIAQWTVQLLALVKGYPLFNPTQAFQQDIDFSAYLLPEAIYLDRFEQSAFQSCFQVEKPRQDFIESLYHQFCRATQSQTWPDLETRLNQIVANQEEGDEVNYRQLLLKIVRGYEVSNPSIGCCGVTLWSLPLVYDFSNIDFTSDAKVLSPAQGPIS